MLNKAKKKRKENGRREKEEREKGRNDGEVV